MHVLLMLCLLNPLPMRAQQITLVELNCENLFDCQHDSLKQDEEWLTGGVRRWSPVRYWRKLNHIGQEILPLVVAWSPLRLSDDAVARRARH